MARGRVLAIGLLALLTVAAAPLLGTWVLVVAAALVVLAAVTAGRGAAGVAIAAALGALGGLAGAATAFAVLRQYGDTPPYESRAGFAWAAVALGLLAAGSGLLVPTRPRLAAALLVVGSLFGFVAINFFNVNSLYFVAVPACWLAAAGALVARPPTRPASGGAT